MTNATTKIGRNVGLGLALLLAGGAAASAGELNLTWGASHDEVTAGYEIEVVGPDGRVEQTLDAGRETSLLVRDLPDGEERRFRIRPYDRWGHRAKEPSAELVSFPAARVDALEALQSDGRIARGVLVGANFSAKARVVSTRDGMIVLSSVLEAPGRLAFTARLQPGSGAPVVEDLAVLNPARRSAGLIARHKALLDVDASGALDEADLAAVTAAFGAKAGSAGFRAELDVDGDGVIDGDDAAALRQALGHGSTGDTGDTGGSSGSSGSSANLTNAGGGSDI